MSHNPSADEVAAYAAGRADAVAVFQLAAAKGRKDAAKLLAANPAISVQDAGSMLASMPGKNAPALATPHQGQPTFQERVDANVRAILKPRGHH